MMRTNITTKSNTINNYYAPPVIPNLPVHSFPLLFRVRRLLCDNEASPAPFIITTIKPLPESFTERFVLDFSVSSPDSK
jgi:hypothetical protein